LNKYKFTSIPNSTFTRSRKQKIKNYVEWLRSWLPDILIILKRWSLLFIELKRSKKSLSKVSESQKKWLDELNNLRNIEAHVCYWAKKAIEKVKELENL
jgi:septation ring formation regulator EzrA